MTTAPTPPARIVVPIDFSESSAAALAYARMLAAAFSASLHLVHVLPDVLAQPWSAEAYGASLREALQEMRADAETRLEGLVAAPERGRVDLTVATGDPYVEIVRLAARQAADLIVMGTHGRGPVAHFLMGSVAEKVVRRAPCPVLTLRDPRQPIVVP